ncbi:hypothetical protein MRX96_039327 [Rhipicephalus microplus]
MDGAVMDRRRLWYVRVFWVDHFEASVTACGTHNHRWFLLRCVPRSLLTLSAAAFIASVFYRQLIVPAPENLIGSGPLKCAIETESRVSGALLKRWVVLFLAVLGNCAPLPWDYRIVCHGASTGGRESPPRASFEVKDSFDDTASASFLRTGVCPSRIKSRERSFSTQRYRNTAQCLETGVTVCVLRCESEIALSER